MAGFVLPVFAVCTNPKQRNQVLPKTRPLVLGNHSFIELIVNVLPVLHVPEASRLQPETFDRAEVFTIDVSDKNLGNLTVVQYVAAQILCRIGDRLARRRSRDFCVLPYLD